MSAKKEYIQKLEEELGIWDAKIDIIESDKGKIKKEHIKKYEKDLNEILALQKKAKTTLKTIKNQDDKEWKVLQEGADEIWKEIETSIEKALTFEP